MADEFVRQQLKLFNLANYIKPFAENKITENVFKEMTDSMIKELIPVVGDRYNFICKRNELLRQDESVLVLGLLPDGNTLHAISVAENANNETEAPIDEAIVARTYSNEDVDTGNEDVDLVPCSPKLRSHESQIANPVADNSKEQNKNNNQANGHAQHLRELLATSFDGQLLASEKSLTDHTRSDLLKIVSQHILAKKEKITRSVYEAWAKAIVELFPNEKNSTYYEYDAVKKKSRGKLYYKVTNTCKSKKKSSIKVVEEKENSNAKDVKADLLNTIKFIDPFDKNVLKLWEETFFIRDRKNTIDEYFHEYPVLMTQTGVKLLELDFQISQKTSSKLFVESWPNIGKRVLQIAKEKKLCPVYTDLIPHVEANTLSLFVFPYLFKPVFLGRKNIKKPSRAEMAEAFIIKKPSIASLEPRDANQTGQPTVIVIGSLPAVTNVFVQIGSTRYEMENLMTAVSFCFQSFFALNASYPRNIEIIWHFIEKHIFHLEKNKSSTAFSSVDDVYRMIFES